MILQKFARNEKGNISIIFAGSMIAIFGAVGLAVDYSRLTQEKHVTQNALDASSLAAAIEFQDSGSITQAETIGTEHMKAILPEIDVTKLNFDIQSKFLTGSYSDEIDNTFLAVFTAPATSYSVNSKVDYMNNSVADFALAVDVSSSMVNHNLLAGLRSSLSNFAGEVYNKNKTGEITVSVVPFSNAVSFAPKYTKWLDENYGYSQTNTFNGCFEYVPLGTKNALSKTGYSSRIAAFPRVTNKNIPFCTNSHSDAAFYIDNETDLSAKLSSLTTAQGTNTAAGLTWAWRMLSPSWQDTFGESNLYPREHSPENKKVIILLTDGKPYSIPSVKVPGEDKNQARKKALTEFEKVCAQIVAAGDIDLYTIVYGNVMSQLQRKAIGKCIAGNGRSYWGGTSDQLSAILSVIVARNRALALTR